LLVMQINYVGASSREVISPLKKQEPISKKTNKGKKSIGIAKFGMLIFGQRLKLSSGF